MRMWDYSGGDKITWLGPPVKIANVINEAGAVMFQGDLLACLKFLANKGNRKAQCHLREIYKAGRPKQRW